MQPCLGRPDITIRFMQVRGEGMAESVAGSAFGQTSFSHRHGGCLSNGRFVNVMPPFVAGSGFFHRLACEKNQLPTPLFPHVDGLALGGVEHKPEVPPVAGIALVDRPDLLRIFLQRRHELAGQHADSLFRPLAVRNENSVSREVYVLKAQTKAPHPTKP